MRLEIQGIHLDLTDALKDYVDKKLGEPLRRLAPNATTMTVRLTIDGKHKDHQDHECHVLLHLPHVQPIVVSEKDKNMYGAIDRAHDVLLARAKHEIQSHRDA